MGSGKGNFKYIKDNEFSFFNLFKEYLVQNEFLSIFHVLITSIVTLLFIFIIDRFELYSEINNMINIIINADIGIFSVLIAAFGLFAAITDKEFAKDIYKLNEIGNVLFPFWLCSVLWLINLILNILFLLLLSMDETTLIIERIIILVSISGFIISLGYTLGIIGDIIKLTIRRAQLELIKDEIAQDSEDVYSVIYDSEIIDKNYSRFLKFFNLVLFFVTIFVVAWFYYLKGNIFFDMIIGALLFATFFLFYKTKIKLNEKNQRLLLKKLRLIFKIIIIIFSIWLGVFIL